MLGGWEMEARWKEGTFKSYVDIEITHVVVSVGKLPTMGRICDVASLKLLLWQA